MPLHRDSADSGLLSPLAIPSLSRVFDAAARYETALEEAGISKGSVNNNGEETLGFGDLMSAPDTDSDSEEAFYAQLSVTGETWSPPDSEVASIGEEPEDADSGIEVFDTTKYEKDLSDAVSFHGESREESWKLPPAEIVKLIVDEFGELAEGDEREELLAEDEGALRQEILILGVAHLTTHRVAFHASLLPETCTKPTGPIKAGPVIIHTRFSWWMNRRVWMSLTPDSISIYRSSKDEDQLKPIRTTLLSSIKELLPANEKFPKVVHIVFEGEMSPDGQPHEGIAEWDTVESAQEWRKEIQAAMFLYKRRRRDAMQSAGQESGVRISLPLSRISEVHISEEQTCAIVLHFHPTEKDSVLGQDSPSDTQIFSFITYNPTSVWRTLSDLLTKARSTTSPPVFVDFGPIHFLGRYETPSVDVENQQEHAVRKALALGHSKLWMTKARLFSSICGLGVFVISDSHVAFWSKSLTGNDVRYRLRLALVKGVKLSHVKTPGAHGISLQIEGQHGLKFDLKTNAAREEAMKRINASIQTLEAAASAPPSPMECESSSSRERISPSVISFDASPASPVSSTGGSSLKRSATNILAPLRRTTRTFSSHKITQEVRLAFPKVINYPLTKLGGLTSTHFVALTIGSRGDVQPYIALGLGLKEQGHHYTIVTHEEYKSWIESFGLAHRTAGGDPAALMKLSVENKIYSPEFIKESLTNFRPWLDALLLDAWEQCHDAEVLIESPSAMAGVHIAEALHIPYFRAFTMPWTKTAAFPHAFLSPPVESPGFNRASYILFSNVMWAASSGQINRWRKHTLHVPATDMNHLAQSKIPFIYNFSPAVVPKPLDWSDSTVVSGYWFLDNPDPDWMAPQSLLDWMAKAKADQKPIVYIGFGSITVPDPHKMTTNLISAVLKSDVCAIISKGWSDRLSKSTESPVVFPPECYGLDKVPHDWLFPKIDAALHHGGAGTTGASLRAGIPTIIKPWFGDQFFWASRVQSLGAGLKVSSLSVSDLSHALIKATTSRVMKEKAAIVGTRIRSENGVHNAIHALYTYLPRAGLERTSLD